MNVLRAGDRPIELFPSLPNIQYGVDLTRTSVELPLGSRRGQVSSPRGDLTLELAPPEVSDRDSLAYTHFCEQAFGEYLHHSPKEATPRRRLRRGKLTLRRSLVALVSAALMLGTGATGAIAFKGFESPSHNIGCVMTEQGARCDIDHHSWPLPKKPKSCEFDYGGSVFVGDKGRGGFGCVSDNAFGTGSVLPCGESIRKGRFLCASEEIGVRCVNRRDRHGFFLSRQRVRFF